jgi:HK97 family phage portal protein
MKNASKEEVERNREFLKKEYTSAANAHKPLLLEGDVEVSKSVSSPAEMQFIEGRRQLTMEILAVFDLPYTKLGGTSESANRSQSAENDKTYRTETISPLQGIVEEVINENLILNTFGIDDVVFEHREVDTRDEATQMSLYIDALKNGIYDLNYIRTNLGLSTVPGGDEPFMTTSMGIMPISQLLNGSPQPNTAAPAQPAADTPADVAEDTNA